MKITELNELEKQLWKTADQLWANTGLSPFQFSTPVLGLIFLRYAEKRFVDIKTEIEQKGTKSKRRRRNPKASENKITYQAKNAFYLPEKSRFSSIKDLPESTDMGKAINDAMKAIEDENEDLKGVLPKNYNSIPDAILIELIRLLSPLNMDGDAFGKVYEYFLSKFAMKEGRKGGVFYTPTAIVKLIVEILEPYGGRIFDPACGSGGMFVQSARFVKRHKEIGAHSISVYGTEKDRGTIKLSKMNMAVHGLSGDIIQANTYYEDPHECVGKFDFVMANPPFNVSGVDKDRLKKDPRFKYGLPSTDNANYLWIQIFANSLGKKGRAGFVMANSAGDARHSEFEIRKKIIEDDLVDVMVSISSNFFYTVTLPCTLWFLNKNKANKNKVLFIDARKIFRQIDRAHRDFTPAQIEFLANIVRMHRGKELEHLEDSKKLLQEYGLDKGYQDIPGLCKAASIAEIKEQGYSLNPGRYVGVPEREDDDIDFYQNFNELNEELNQLNTEAQQLQEIISENAKLILEDE